MSTAFFFTPRMRLLIVLLLALALRLLNLNAPVWGDETASWAFARRAPFGEMWRYGMNDTSPPLYYALLHVTMPLVGVTPFALRALSVFAGVLLVALVYVGMRRAAFDTTSSLWAALLTAVSSMLVYYAQEARQYSLLVCETTASTILLFALIRKPNRLTIALYGLTLPLMSYTHTAAIYVIAAHLCCLLLFRRWRLLLAATGVAALSSLNFVERVIAGTYFFAPSGRELDGDALWSFVISLTTGTVGMQGLTILPNASLLKFPVPAIDAVLPLLGLLAVSAIALSGFAQRARLNSPQRQWIVVLLVCTLVPTGLALLAGSQLTPRPQWLLRSILFVWTPFFMLLSAWCAPALRRYLLGALVCLNLLCLQPYYANYTRSADVTVFADLSQRASSRDLVVADPWYMHDFIRYYYAGPAPFAGYDEEFGWVDVAQMERSNEYQFFRLSAPPQTQGDVYVFYRGEQLRWADAFPHNTIFVFEPRTRTWRDYREP